VDDPPGPEKLLELLGQAIPHLGTIGVAWMQKQQAVEVAAVEAEAKKEAQIEIARIRGQQNERDAVRRHESDLAAAGAQGASEQRAHELALAQIAAERDARRFQVIEKLGRNAIWSTVALAVGIGGAFVWAVMDDKAKVSEIATLIAILSFAGASLVQTAAKQFGRSDSTGGRGG
jgi:hypothetical protein